MKKNLLLFAFLSVISFSIFAQGGATILDDTDAGWTWTGFEVDEQPEAYGGIQHVAQASGSTAEFSFTGRDIKFYGETWNGGPSLEIFIDGVSKGTFSQSITPEGLKNLFATITGLDNVNHAVKLVSIGEWASIDYVDFTPITILDDKDAGFIWTGFTVDEQPDAYLGQQHVAEFTGSTVEFNFTGTNIDFYGETWAGAASFEIFVDNVSKGTFSQSIVPEGLKNLFASIVGLENINHAVKMVSIGEWASLDYVDFASKIDDTDAGWVWTGFVLDDPNPECYRGFQHVAELTGSTAEFEFTGRSIQFYGETWAGAASFEIFIDEVSKGTFSQSITPEGRKNLFATITGLDNVNHSVKLVSIGEWASIDYVEYSPELIVILPDPNVTASAENEGEVALNLADGILTTQWSAPGSSAWIQFAYKEPKTWNKYSLTSGNDEPTSDFKDWTLHGSQDGTTWTILDTQTAHPQWATRNSTLDFAFENLSAYKYYKFDVTANNGGNATQLAEIAFSFFLPEEALIFTTTGSAASYITYNNWYSLQADSITLIEKTTSPIAVDANAEVAWSEANSYVIKKAVNELDLGDVMDLSVLPQSVTDLYATVKTLWNDNGVYMFFEVKDDFVRYQNYDYQWENDGIEFYFSKAIGESKIQIIIPAMVGTPNPNKPAALDFESGAGVGSDPDYKVFGFDNDNWDASLFNWAMKKTTDGYNLEVYMDKDIVTNNNSLTHYGLDKIFCGDFNVDEADEEKNDNDPALYIRESTLGLMSNSNQEYASSNNYGYFKMVDVNHLGVNDLKPAVSYIIYDFSNKQILVRNSDVYSVVIYNSLGQIIENNQNNNTISVSNFVSGIYFINAIDAAGKVLSVKKIIVN